MKCLKCRNEYELHDPCVNGDRDCCPNCGWRPGECPNCEGTMDESVHIDSDGYGDPIWVCRNCGNRENREVKKS